MNEVTFYGRSVLSEEKTRKENKEVFELVTYVRVQSPPSQGGSVIDRPARLGLVVDSDSQKYPAEYAAFLLPATPSATLAAPRELVGLAAGLEQDVIDGSPAAPVLARIKKLAEAVLAE